MKANVFRQIAFVKKKKGGAEAEARRMPAPCQAKSAAARKSSRWIFKSIVRIFLSAKWLLEVKSLDKKVRAGELEVQRGHKKIHPVDFLIQRVDFEIA